MVWKQNSTTFSLNACIKIPYGVFSSHFMPLNSHILGIYFFTLFNKKTRGLTTTAYYPFLLFFSLLAFFIKLRMANVLIFMCGVCSLLDTIKYECWSWCRLSSSAWVEFQQCVWKWMWATYMIYRSCILAFSYPYTRLPTNVQVSLPISI